MRALSLVLLAALCGAALGRDFSPAGRELLQAAAECDRAVPGCKTCRFQFFRGTVTRAICTQCVTGYVVKNRGLTCACAPGYYQPADSNDCVPCTQGYYCPGSKLTRADSLASRRECTPNIARTTLSAVAKSAKECVTRPGYGPSGECGIGFYNPGGNTRACTRCPGGLTTATATAKSPAECVAPKGSYYLRGKALPCAQGTYKDFEGNADCQKCPDGTTTTVGAVGKTQASECNLLLPGYSTTEALNGTFNATECDAGYYRAETVPATGAVPCNKCPGKSTTLPLVTGATSLDACVAPPGTYWKDTTEGAIVCAKNTYSSGYDRETSCKSCGTGVLTAEPGADAGAESESDCYIPAGYGSDLVGDVLTATICPANTYGRPNATYGLLEVECTKCPENTETNTTTGNTDIGACLTKPGYGYDDGAVNQCDFGTYAPGGTDDACSTCPAFYNTTTTPPTLGSKTVVAETGAIMGASDVTQCVVGAGVKFTNGVNNTDGLSPCPRGTYNEWLNYGACDSCPNGTTTLIVSGATKASDCDACQPGYFGLLSDLGASTCTACGSGTYSAGLQLGGTESCTNCTVAYTGATMVSRAGLSSADGCVPEFPSAGGDPSKYTWDLIAPLSSDNVAVIDAATAQVDCQSACDTAADCMYFVFSAFNRTLPGGQIGQCFLYKSSAANVDASTVTWTDNVPSAAVLVLEVKAGSYVAFPVGNATVGAEINSGLDFAKARDNCEKDPLCVGFSNAGNEANGWRTIKAGLYPDVQTKIKAYGSQINPWAPAAAIPANAA